MAAGNYMAKRKRYTDDFRASAVLMLEAAGYPDQKGALVSDAKNVKVPHQTLSRWARGVQNPAPHQLVQEKKLDLIDLIENELRAIYATMPKERDDATYRELGVVGGILHDKYQLLRGGATANVNNRIVVQYVDDWRRADN